LIKFAFNSKKLTQNLSMLKNYSVAIEPSEEIISLVKSMKNLLAEKIGWFHSKNSVAHITIFEFKSSDTEIEIIKNKLSRICDGLAPVEVTLNQFGSYPSGAFYIAPNEDSKNNLIKLMKHIQQSFPTVKMQKSVDPHISIARKLNHEKIQMAYSVFKLIDEFFICNEVVLRKFDENIKQYRVIERFSLNNNSQAEEIQGTLF
jgi:2'-5' RNA ligase